MAALVANCRFPHQCKCAKIMDIIYDIHIITKIKKSKKIFSKKNPIFGVFKFKKFLSYVFPYIYYASKTPFKFEIRW